MRIELSLLCVSAERGRGEKPRVSKTLNPSPPSLLLLRYSVTAVTVHRSTTEPTTIHDLNLQSSNPGYYSRSLLLQPFPSPVPHFPPPPRPPKSPTQTITSTAIRPSQSSPRSAAPPPPQSPPQAAGDLHPQRHATIGLDTHPHHHHPPCHRRDHRTALVNPFTTHNTTAARPFASPFPQRDPSPPTSPTSITTPTGGPPTFHPIGHPTIIHLHRSTIKSPTKSPTTTTARTATSPATLSSHRPPPNLPPPPSIITAVGSSRSAFPSPPLSSSLWPHEQAGLPRDPPPPSPCFRYNNIPFSFGNDEGDNHRSDPHSFGPRPAHSKAHSAARPWRNNKWALLSP